MKKIYQLQTIQEWQECKQHVQSSANGLIIFKFSPNCPISRSVERGVDPWYAQLPEEVDLLCAKIDVINARALSQQIAQELHIPHASPQAIWMAADATIHWHASHYAITSAALNTQLQKLKVHVFP